MQKLTDGIILYHGSYCEVPLPELNKCAANKDFGQGFYLTTSREQAESFVKASIKKAIAIGLIDSDQNYGFVSSFQYNKILSLKEYIFDEANVDWLHCIVGHRKENTFSDIVENMKNYDIIGGKIADDKTNITITTYLLGGYGEIGSKGADSICIGQLIPERLQNQYCFRTQTALDCLSYKGSEKIWKV